MTGKLLVFALLLAIVPVWPQPSDASRMSLHDRSAFVSFDYFAAHGFHFGTEVINNVGPLGFLSHPGIYTGRHTAARLVAQYLLAAIYALMVVRALALFATPARQAALLFLGGFLMDGGLYPIYVLWGIHYLATADRLGRHRLLDFAVPCLLAVLSHTKANCLMLTIAGLGIYLTQQLARRRWTEALRVGGLFLLAFTGTWGLAGQSLADLPVHLRALAEFSSGYQEIMGLDEHYGDTLLGIGALGCYALLAIGRWRLGQRQDGELGWWAFAAVWLFLAFKHGFVRADDHMWDGFYRPFLVAAPLLFLTGMPAPDRQGPSPGKGLVGLHWTLLLAAVALSLSFYVGLHRANTLRGLLGARLAAAAANLARPFTAGAYLEQLGRDWGNFGQQLALPRTRAVCGSATVDHFGSEPGHVLLNGLNYRPRPMAINFAAFNETLQTLNRDYYLDPARRPAFVLAQVATIDDRLAAQDDALALLALWQHYRPVHRERDQVLLRAQPLRPVDRPETLATVHTELGAAVSLPPGSDPLWVRIDLGDSLLGRLRSFLYKPPQIQIELTYADGRTASFRYNSPAGRSGFLIRPLIRDNADLLAAYGDPGTPPPPVLQSFVLKGRRGCEPFFRRPIAVTFGRVSVGHPR